MFACARVLNYFNMKFTGKVTREMYSREIETFCSLVLNKDRNDPLLQEVYAQVVKRFIGKKYNVTKIIWCWSLP